MLEFKPILPEERQKFAPYLAYAQGRGCEYNFTNLYMWGRQTATFVGERLVCFSQYNRKSVYLFPVGPGELKPALDAIVEDAAHRGIPCRISGMSQENIQQLEQLRPGEFTYHFDRDSFDYVYAAQQLATLAGKRMQKKRNHLNRFRKEHPDTQLHTITEDSLPRVEQMVSAWFSLRQQTDPHGDFSMEKAAISKAFHHWNELGLEGVYLENADGQILAMAAGSLLWEDTFDIHFEKALDIADGTYGAVNNGFAQYLVEKYPQLRWLNREDDLGIEGLRQAKLSFCPEFLVEKTWACRREDGYDY